MTSFFKSHGLVLMAAALPFILLIGVLLFAYIPNRSVPTKYNFVYASCGDMQYYPVTCSTYIREKYGVKDGVLVETSKKMEAQYKPRFFIYDTTTKISTEVSVDNLMRGAMQNNDDTTKLTGLVTSPDDVYIDSGYSRGGGDFFIFGGGSSRYGWYLRRGDTRERIDLIDGSRNGYPMDGAVEVISWIER